MILKLSVKSFLNGKQVDGFDLRESHTWVRNMYMILLNRTMKAVGDGSGYGDGELNVKLTTGSISAPTSSSFYSVDWEAAAGTLSGIVVGTSATAWDFDDYKLGTIVAHGNTTNCLSYVLGPAPTAGWVGDVLTVTGLRYFNNNSGGTIGINEVGLYMVPVVTTIMTARDVLGATVNVPDSGQLLVTYQISGDCSP